MIQTQSNQPTQRNPQNPPSQPRAPRPRKTERQSAQERRTDQIFLGVKIALIAFLVIYIFLIFRGSSGMTVDMAALETALQGDSTVTALTQGDRSDLSKTFGLDSAGYEACLLYSADNVMDVSELLVVKTSDPEQQAALMEAAETHLEELKTSWEHYGTNQYEILGNAVILQKGDCFFFGVSENIDQWKEEVLSCVK